MWLVALLTALIGAFALTARIEHLQGRVLARGVVAGEAARAGLEYALVRIADPDPAGQWRADGRPRAWRFGAAEVTVRIVDETGKVDLNQADAVLLGGLFRVVGAAPEEAAAVAAAIIDWRDGDVLSQPQGGAEDPQYAAAERPYGAKDAPFDSIGEVEQVLGMTPALYARVAEHLTIFSVQPQPDQTYAGAVVLEAMGLDPGPILQRREGGGGQPEDAFVGAGSGTYSIDSRARLPDGRQATLRAVVRAEASGVPGSAYTPLRWEEGASPR